jgi:hypothetical protein
MNGQRGLPAQSNRSPRPDKPEILAVAAASRNLVPYRRQKPAVSAISGTKVLAAGTPGNEPCGLVTVSSYKRILLSVKRG